MTDLCPHPTEYYPHRFYLSTPPPPEPADTYATPNSPCYPRLGRQVPASLAWQHPPGNEGPTQEGIELSPLPEGGGKPSSRQTPKVKGVPPKSPAGLPPPGPHSKGHHRLTSGKKVKGPRSGPKTTATSLARTGTERTGFWVW